MVTFTPQQIADLKASIAARYFVETYNNETWAVFDRQDLCVSGNDHGDPLDAEAEMDAIIQDEVKAAMEEME